MYGMFEEHSILVSDENVINDYTLKIHISFDVENGLKAAEYIHNAVSKWFPLRPWCLTLKILL